jgi:hypothetical protein
MKTVTCLLFALLATAGVADASDRIGVYAIIDKVVLEPGPEAPDRIQVWGVFTLADGADRVSYRAPVRGYMYFKASGGNATAQQMARREWADFQSVAGQRQVIGWGARYQTWRVRPASERPEKPDEYHTDTGATLVRSNTSYSPIRALLDFKDR